jgi:hypothetical protein
MPKQGSNLGPLMKGRLSERRSCPHEFGLEGLQVPLRSFAIFGCAWCVMSVYSPVALGVLLCAKHL